MIREAVGLRVVVGHPHDGVAALGERWNVHAEYFGLFSHAREADFVRHFVSPGVHVLLTPDLEVGVRLGWGLNDQSARFFSNVGVGWRF